jgi:hypothetical protein
MKNNQKEPKKITKNKILNLLNDSLKEVKLKIRFCIELNNDNIKNIDQIAYGFYKGQLKLLNTLKKQIEEMF